MNVWKVQTRLRQHIIYRCNLHYYKRQQQLQQTEGDNTEADSFTADGPATQASRPSMTARSQSVIVLGENGSDLFGDPDDRELYELLEPTLEPNSLCTRQSNSFVGNLIWTLAAIRNKVKTLPVALAEEVGCTNELPLVAKIQRVIQRGHASATKRILLLVSVCG